VQHKKKQEEPVQQHLLLQQGLRQYIKKDH
jgi:hypothetical protein